MFQSILAWAQARKRLLLLVGISLTVIMIVWQGISLFQWVLHPRSSDFFSYYNGNQATQEALLTSQQTVCQGAPFLLPAEGYIGLFYGDPRGPYSQSSPHQGIDIFATESGITPIYAAYDGYLTREQGWTSSVIMRIPEDPLYPERQIWLYYTHMADITGETSFISEAFPRGTTEKYVKRGTFLGLIGDYNGSATRTISPHLHFSIVLDNGAGQYTNELIFNNTVDPSRYFSMPLNYACALDVVTCSGDPVCRNPVLSLGGN